MKFFAYLLCFYLTALTVLPSIRAIKMQLSEKCQSTCQKMNSDNDEQSGCEKGKIIMNLSFNPVHYISSNKVTNNDKIEFIEVIVKDPIVYREVFISNYKNSIWQPPKIFS
jgi:hypothetical protein